MEEEHATEDVKHALLAARHNRTASAMHSAGVLIARRPSASCPPSSGRTKGSEPLKLGDQGL